MHPPRMLANAVFSRVSRDSTVTVAKDGGGALAGHLLSALLAFLQMVRNGGHW